MQRPCQGSPVCLGVEYQKVEGARPCDLGAFGGAFGVDSKRDKTVSLGLRVTL